MNSLQEHEPNLIPGATLPRPVSARDGSAQATELVHVLRRWIAEIAPAILGRADSGRIRRNL